MNLTEQRSCLERVITGFCIYALVIILTPSENRYDTIAIVVGLIFSALGKRQIGEFKYLAVAATYYLAFSTVEWSIHRFVMHGEAGFTSKLHKLHIEHHKNVRSDMKLHDEIADDDGSGEFIWRRFFEVSIFLQLILFKYMHKEWGIHPRINLAIVSGASLMNMWLWNNIHNSMHEDEKQVSWTFGPPRLFNSEKAESFFAPFFEVWKKNHWLHHAIKSRKTNFCTIFLGADKVWGTSPTQNELSEAGNYENKVVTTRVEAQYRKLYQMLKAKQSKKNIRINTQKRSDYPIA